MAPPPKVAVSRASTQLRGGEGWRAGRNVELSGEIRRCRRCTLSICRLLPLLHFHRSFARCLRGGRLRLGSCSPGLLLVVRPADGSFFGASPYGSLEGKQNSKTNENTNRVLQEQALKKGPIRSGKVINAEGGLINASLSAHIDVLRSSFCLAEREAKEKRFIIFLD